MFMQALKNEVLPIFLIPSFSSIRIKTYSTHKKYPFLKTLELQFFEMNQIYFDAYTSYKGHSTCDSKNISLRFIKPQVFYFYPRFLFILF